MTSVGEDFPIQQQRVRTIQQHAREIGPAGGFLVAMCEQALQRADRAAISGDPVAILASYQELSEFKD